MLMKNTTAIKLPQFRVFLTMLIVSTLGLRAGPDVEADILKFFHNSRLAILSEKPRLLAPYLPEEGIILIDKSKGNAKEIKVSKEKVLTHQTTTITPLIKSGKLFSNTTPLEITTKSNQVAVIAQMIEISLVKGKKVAAVSRIRSVYQYRKGQLKIIRSELLEERSFALDLKSKQDVKPNP